MDCGVEWLRLRGVPAVMGRWGGCDAPSAPFPSASAAVPIDEVPPPLPSPTAPPDSTTPSSSSTRSFSSTFEAQRCTALRLLSRPTPDTLHLTAFSSGALNPRVSNSPPLSSSSLQAPTRRSQSFLLFICCHVIDHPPLLPLILSPLAPSLSRPRPRLLPSPGLHCVSASEAVDFLPLTSSQQLPFPIPRLSKPNLPFPTAHVLP